MSAGPSDRERISSLERSCETHGSEIEKLRERSHAHASKLQTLLNWEFDRRVAALEAFKNRAVGIAVGLGFGSGLVAALILKLIER